jgi:hypothetical protein
MREKRWSLAAACVGCALAMSAVGAQNARQHGSAPAGAVVLNVIKPSSPGDMHGWNRYLSGIVRQNSQGVSADRTFLYFVPAGGTEAEEARQRQVSTVQDRLAHRVPPGNLIAFGGPDSDASADFVVNAFRNAPADACRGSIVLFIGEPADETRVADAVQASGGTLRFADMSGPTYLLGSASAQAPTPVFILPPPPSAPPPLAPLLQQTAPFRGH